MHPLIADFPEISLHDLSIPLAKQFVRYVSQFGFDTAKFLGARQFGIEREIVLIDVATCCGQRPVYSFNRREVLGVLFSKTEAPRVLSMRTDFPDTPHQNWSAEGQPFSPCIDNRSWEVARLTYTSSELLQRIVQWFQQASKGELHGSDQPLDPNLLDCGPTLILPEDIFSLSEDQCNVLLYGRAIRSEGEEKFLLVHFSIEMSQSVNEQGRFPGFFFVPIELRPERMTRMRQAPSNLGSLYNELSVRGCDLWEILRNYILELWEKNGDARVGIVVKMPMINPTTGYISGDSVTGFILDANIKDLGLALGVLAVSPAHYSGEKCYGLAIPRDSVNVGIVDEISVQACPVSQPFTTTLAAKLAGRTESLVKSAVLVGAGAVGALVIESLFREGRFNLAIVDRDIFLPHNLARHTLHSAFIGMPKAEALALYLEQIIHKMKPSFYYVDILKVKYDHDVYRYLKSAEIILDASASIPVSRYLSDLNSKARRISFFYNPSGTGAAILIEDEGRNVDLRCIEATMYGMVLSNPEIEDFWRVKADMVPYSGDCRAVTTRLAVSTVHILSGLIAQGLGRGMESPDALLSMWCLKSDGTVYAKKMLAKAPASMLERGPGGWTIRVLSYVQEQILSLRSEKLPNETGGSLLGVVDIPSKRIEVMAIVPPPPDSKERPDGFERGVDGLYSQVMNAIDRCNNEVRYVGEWHSHPPCTGLCPSQTDIEQISFLTSTLSDDGCPGVQIIAGETSLNIILGVNGSIF